MRISYDEVLPSKWGSEDHIPTPSQSDTAMLDLTELAGAKAQIDYVKERKELGEQQWKAIESQIRLRVSQCLQEALAEAKCKLKESLYTNDFLDVCTSLKDESANLTLISSRYL